MLPIFGTLNMYLSTISRWEKKLKLMILSFTKNSRMSCVTFREQNGSIVSSFGFNKTKSSTPVIENRNGFKKTIMKDQLHEIKLISSRFNKSDNSKISLFNNSNSFNHKTSPKDQDCQLLECLKRKYIDSRHCLNGQMYLANLILVIPSSDKIRSSSLYRVALEMYHCLRMLLDKLKLSVVLENSLHKAISKQYTNNNFNNKGLFKMLLSPIGWK